MENPIKMDDLGGKKTLFLAQHPYPKGSQSYLTGPPPSRFLKASSTISCNSLGASYPAFST